MTYGNHSINQRADEHEPDRRIGMEDEKMLLDMEFQEVILMRRML